MGLLVNTAMAILSGDMTSTSQLAGDLMAGAVGTGYVGASLLGFIHGVEVVVAGALVIVLLLLRIRAHLKDRK